MNTITKTSVYLQITALLLTTAFAGPVAGDKQLPFRGSLPGDEISELPFPLFFVQGSGTGNAAHLGHFTAIWEREGSLIDGSQTASYHFIAANGDSLFIESVGQADMTLAPDIHVVEIAIITGGTGRFTGATGTFMIERVVVVLADFHTTTSHSFEGTIVLNKGK